MSILLRPLLPYLKAGRSLEIAEGREVTFRGVQAIRRADDEYGRASSAHSLEERFLYTILFS